MRTNVLITSPFKSISGYGLKSLDLVESIIELKPEWNIQLIKTKWGNNPDREYTKLDKYIVENITHAPDIYIHIGMPDEMKLYGTEKNILITSSTEVTLVPSEWISKVNTIDLTIVPSKFNKDVFEKTIFTDAQGAELKTTKPIEVLFEGYNENIFNNKVTSEFDLSNIKEQFAFLSVGQFTGGQVFGQDRKNIGNMIRMFYETFKNKPNQPALILKSNMGNHSKVDKYSYEEYIKSIQKTFNSKNLPNVYLLHGELSDEQMNQLYNHPKVKAMISLTRGESVGRPLLEFSITGKPIIAPKHSGYLDFLDEKYYTLIGGSLQQIHPSTAWKAMIPESHWFEANYQEFSFRLNDMFKNHKTYLKESKVGGDIIKRNFSKEKMKLKLNQILKDYVPEKVELKIPDFLRNK
jgi:glycosyltransferase involved in cell wall biosynthesis